MLKRIISLFLLTGLFLIASCVHTPDVPTLEELYKAAITDARIATPEEISRSLTGISTPENKNTQPFLVWKKINGVNHVLVNTWAGEYIAAKNWKPGETHTLASTTNIWITACPELKNFFHKNKFWPATHEERILRIEQLLGLPAGDHNVRFIEFWVNPADIFRPTPDPDPTDHEAQLEYPWKRSRFQTMNPTHKIHEYVDSNTPDREYDYVQWFENLNATSYTATPPYPWTRLGYTYDWANDKHNNNHIGLSEFIAKGGATITIERTVDTKNLEDYFKKP